MGGGTGTLLALGWLWLAVATAGCRAQTDQEGLLRSAGPAGPASSPRRPAGTGSALTQVQLDVRRRILSWKSSGHVTQQSCDIETPGGNFNVSGQAGANGTGHCMLHHALLHRGARLRVEVTSDGETFRESLTVRNSGLPASGAHNLSCIIYDIDFMNCSWVPGPAAPTDVQYHLDVWTSVLEEDDLMGCPQYVTDPAGMAVGCRFHELWRLKGPQYYFFLNGSSQHQAIPFLDFLPWEGYQMEKCSPPSNLTAERTASTWTLRWGSPPRRFQDASHMLCFHLDIRKNGRSRDPVLQVGQDENEYQLPLADAHGAYCARVRVRHKYSPFWSEWSHTLDFALPEPSFPNTGVTVVLPALGASLILALLLRLLLRRCCLRQKLFPPIPQVKNLLQPGAEIICEGDHVPLPTQEPEALRVEETVWLPEE